MPLTAAKIHIESAAMQTPVTHPGYQSYQSVKTANIANSVSLPIRYKATDDSTFTRVPAYHGQR